MDAAGTYMPHEQSPQNDAHWTDDVVHIAWNMVTR